MRKQQQPHSVVSVVPVQHCNKDNCRPTVAESSKRGKVICTVNYQRRPFAADRACLSVQSSIQHSLDAEGESCSVI